MWFLATRNDKLEEEMKTREKTMTIKEKEMNTSQIYRADSAPEAPRSALRGLTQGLGLTLLACAFVISLTGSEIVADARDEAAVRRRSR